jgi:rSAM/selenodomain-associated transferase 2
VNIAVVIPALNEASTIERVVASAMGPEGGATAHLVNVVDVVVVDGGSEDETQTRAISAGARILNTQRGRARQLQVGIEATKSDVVLLLHADTCLPPGWATAVLGALDDPRVVGGAFRLKFEERSTRIRLVEWMARMRIAALEFPFGDQAIFVRRAVLDAVGGIADVPVMEDVDLVHAMKQHGRLALLPDCATTSARRYLDRGVLRTSVTHFFAFTAWGLGIDRTRLAEWLRR